MIRLVALIFLFFVVSCNGQASRNSSMKTEQEIVIDTISKLKLSNGIEIMQLNLGNNPRDIVRIVRDSKIIGELSLPVPDVEVKNFTVNKIKETKSGFFLSVNWGGGTNFYGRNFYFELKEAEKAFYLNKVEKISYSHESDTKTSKQEDINTPIRVDGVRLSKFIINE